MGKKLILVWVIVGFFTSHFSSAQTIKLGIRGGTFSPISLYEALAKKNPSPYLISYTTSRPYGLSLGATVEHNKMIYAANASVRRVDILNKEEYSGIVGNSFFETYDFDLGAGYKLIQTPKSSLNAIAGFGLQSRYDYNSSSFFIINEDPNSLETRNYVLNEIKPVSKLPVFLLLKTEGDFALSERWGVFFTIETNLFLGRSYYLGTTMITQQGDQVYYGYNDGTRFSNNSISSTLGFRYALFKGNS